MEETPFDINLAIKWVGKGHSIGWVAKKFGTTYDRVAEALDAFYRLQNLARKNVDEPSLEEKSAELTQDEEEELKAIGVLEGTTEQAKWLARRGWHTADIARKLGKRYQQIHHAVGRK